MFSIVLCVYPEVRLYWSIHMVILFLSFLGNLFTVTAYFTLTLFVHKYSNSYTSIIALNIFCCCFFIVAFLIGMRCYDIIVFDLHFFKDDWCRVSFSYTCGHLYFSLLKVLFKSLGHFDSDYLLFFLLLNLSSFYIIRILIPYKIMIFKQMCD